MIRWRQRNAKAILGNNTIYYAETLGQAVDGADAAVLMTEWNEFRKADWPLLGKTMATPLLIDLRNMFSLGHAGRMGVRYMSLGRVTVEAGG